VNACVREGRGGSPTAVLDEASLSDIDRRGVPGLVGASHAVFVSVEDGGHDLPLVSLRFFTAEGELPACGHGTVAALAILAQRSGSDEYEATLRASGRTFAGRCVRKGDEVQAAFDPGTIDLREPTFNERDLILPALGVTSDMLAPGMCVGSLGRPRVLVPISTRSGLLAVTPDLPRLRGACDRLGLLGCYVHTVPTAAGRVAARMFAPSIGVAEDIANANSTACLAAQLAGAGRTEITVDMGDSLGQPSTITATTGHSPSGAVIRVGGHAVITRTHHLPSLRSARR